jgi:hypothetical protein
MLSAAKHLKQRRVIDGQPDASLPLSMTRQEVFFTA